MPAIVARIPMQAGDIIRFKTTGYEIADVRNPNPAKEWTGLLQADPTHGASHIILWCEREGREATNVCVALDNIINNDTLGVPYRTTPAGR